MERLTKRNESNTAYYYPKCFEKCDGLGLSMACNRCELQHDMCEKLGHYEDLEEQGLLLKLPCKVGDVVYAYCNEFGILEYEVDSIVIDKHITYQCSAYSEPIGDCPSECLDEIEPDISDFGKTVFLIREEAEEALKIAGGENVLV